jgi:hypothetical protein
MKGAEDAQERGALGGCLFDPGMRPEEVKMLWTIVVILLALWLLGMLSSYTLGGLIHILLLLAIAAILIRVIQGRRPV